MSAANEGRRPLVLATSACEVGGAERYLLECADFMRGCGETPVVLAARSVADRLKSASPDIEVIGGDIDWAWGPEDIADTDDYDRKVARQGEAFAGMLDHLGVAPEAVFLNANWPTHYIGTMLEALARKIPFHAHFHLCPHRIWLSARARRLHEKALPEASSLTCVSLNNRLFLEMTFGGRLRFDIIPNFSRFSVAAEESNSLIETPRDPVFLAVGRLDHQKGFLGIAPGLKRGILQGRTLEIAGQGPLAAILRSQFEGASDSVRLLGSVEDIANRLRRAEALLAPSHFEGMSLSIIEALSLGCPVIASDASSARELIRDGENGFLFRVGDWRSMAAAIERFARADQRALRTAALASSRRFDRRRSLSEILCRLTYRRRSAA